MELDLTALNTAKDALITKKALVGVMEVDAQKYYIPHDELFVLFSEVIDKLGDVVDKINDIEERLTELENPE